MNSKIYPIDGVVRASHIWSLLGMQMAAWIVACIVGYAFFYTFDIWMVQGLGLWPGLSLGMAACYAAQTQKGRAPILTGKSLWKLNLGMLIPLTLICLRSVILVRLNDLPDTEAYPWWLFAIVLIDLPIYLCLYVAEMWFVLKLVRWQNRRAEAKQARLAI